MNMNGWQGISDVAEVIRKKASADVDFSGRL
jgi:hypothetical protein